MFKLRYLVTFLVAAFVLSPIRCDAANSSNGSTVPSQCTTTSGAATSLTTTTKLYKIRVWGGGPHPDSVSARWYGKDVSWQPTHLEFIDCKTNRVVMISSNSSGSIIVEELPLDYDVSGW